MRHRRKGPSVPFLAYEEAVADALRYQQQSKRLLAALKRQKAEADEEILKLQRDLRWAMDSNACLALELSEKDWALAQLRGEC